MAVKHSLSILQMNSHHYVHAIKSHRLHGKSFFFVSSLSHFNGPESWTIVKEAREEKEEKKHMLYSSDRVIGRKR